MSYKKDFIEFMVLSGALTFGDFVTKSGRKTPYFINTGNFRMGSQIARLSDCYARCIEENLGGGYDALFGPAYKGIPLAAGASASLYRIFGRDAPYCFNRKEVKDHGEGGGIIGYRPKDGDRIVIVEDVVTAGTAVRETVAFFKGVADVSFRALIVSVDRKERGSGEKSALRELADEFGIEVFPIVDIDEIVSSLYMREIGGKVLIDDATRDRILRYRDEYGAKERPECQ